jgi:hypothetical protein
VEPADDDRPAPTAVPILLAMGVVLVAGVLAAVFLRADDEGELVRPDRLTAVQADTVRAVVFDRPDCGTVTRAQVDLADRDRVFVELVAVGADGNCPDVTTDIVADVVLPEPIGDRRLVAGVGRVRLPCEGPLTALVCRPAP